MNESPEYIDLFQQIDGMVNAFDAEGAGPLRKGQQPFNWAMVAQLARPLAEAIPDLRVGIWLLRAELATDGLPGLSRSLDRLASWMERPADELHPLPEDDEAPRALHALLLRWLTKPAFTSTLREASAWPGATITVGALAEVSNHKQIVQALGVHPVEDIVATLASAVESVARIDQVLLLEASDTDLNLGLLGEILARARKSVLDSFAQTPAVPDYPSATPATPDPGASGDVGAGIKAHERLRYSIASREDLESALDCINHYFLQHEPGHPAPLFIARIKRMLGASFEDLLQELYPDAAQLLARLERPNPT